MKLVWSFLLSIVATLCVGSAHGVSDISYVITLNKESTADELASLTAAFPVSAITTFTLVNLEVMSVVAEPEAAAAGEATTSVSMMSDAQAVIAYEISDVVVYEEESIRQSALAAVNLTTAQVTVVVNATFVIEGVVVVPLGYSATDLRADLATDIGVPIERVTVVEVSASTRRKLSQLSESTYAYTITSNDFTDATAVKTAMSSPTALGTVGSKLGTVVQNTSAVPKISARVKTIFSSIAETTMKEMFEEKLSFISTAELTRRVNIKLKDMGMWAKIITLSIDNPVMIPVYSTTGRQVSYVWNAGQESDWASSAAWGGGASHYDMMSKFKSSIPGGQIQIGNGYEISGSPGTMCLLTVESSQTHMATFLENQIGYVGIKHTDGTQSVYEPFVQGSEIIWFTGMPSDRQQVKDVEGNDATPMLVPGDKLSFLIGMMDWFTTQQRGNTLSVAFGACGQTIDLTFSVPAGPPPPSPPPGLPSPIVTGSLTIPSSATGDQYSLVGDTLNVNFGVTDGNAESSDGNVLLDPYILPSDMSGSYAPLISASGTGADFIGTSTTVTLIKNMPNFYCDKTVFVSPFMTTFPCNADMFTTYDFSTGMWSSSALSWSAGDSVAIKVTAPASLDGLDIEINFQNGADSNDNSLFSITLSAP
jgi:hypothetical protein